MMIQRVILVIMALIAICACGYYGAKGMGNTSTLFGVMVAIGCAGAVLPEDFPGL